MDIPERPLPPRLCALYVSSGVLFTYPPDVTVTTISSIGIRSSSSKSKPPAVNIERRGVANFSFTSISSSRIIDWTLSRDLKISSKSIIFMESFCASSVISSMPKAVNFKSLNSNIALACSSVNCIVPSLKSNDRGSAIKSISGPID